MTVRQSNRTATGYAKLDRLPCRHRELLILCARIGFNP